MGGSQADAEWKIYRNILLTLVTIGLWHGASWNFVIYGTLHGSAVGFNRWQRKKIGRRPGDPLPGWWAWSLAVCDHVPLCVVVLCRILFRANDLAGAGLICQRLLGIDLMLHRFSPLVWGLLVVGFGIHFTPPRWVMESHQLPHEVGAVRVAVQAQRDTGASDPMAHRVPIDLTVEPVDQLRQILKGVASLDGRPDDALHLVMSSDGTEVLLEWGEHRLVAFGGQVRSVLPLTPDEVPDIIALHAVDWTNGQRSWVVAEGGGPSREGCPGGRWLCPAR